jgi:hypothetical protein
MKVGDIQPPPDGYEIDPQLFARGLQAMQDSGRLIRHYTTADGHVDSVLSPPMEAALLAADYEEAVFS